MLGSILDPATWVDYILSAIGWGFYAIWRILASIAVILEQMFRLLAGIDTGIIINNTSAVSPNATTGPNLQKTDLVSLLIQNTIVQNVFSALVVISIILLLFFAILQIIREQYKNKDGEAKRP